ncbi:PEP-CTERM sorting domain-containing protein [Thalassotalea crassostreae]|uniref:PEP-CTERM sorting domain-containing protein n=1 Tax=Thalassotalea crassostreae TaxID=1763536 RepID=UPI000838A874|nr:PEP-CTERM sorting domain-containing protein [Thalassotalea crassostreae]
MNLTYLKATIAALILSISNVANAGLIFSFEEVDNNVTMTSSGSIDTSGLVEGNTSPWGYTGIESGTYDFLGSTNYGEIDISFGFSAGTDYSAWQGAASPWTETFWSYNFMDFDVVSGTKPFATFIWAAPSVALPGLGIREDDLEGDIWSADHNWIAKGYNFEVLGLNSGSYTVTDAVSGEFITIQIGALNQASVPEPSTLVIFALGILGLASRKFSR